MSERIAEVVQVKLEPHPAADTLSLVNLGGFSVVVKTSDFQDGDLAVYLTPDTIVKTSRPEFSFLGTAEKVRLKVKRLRGIYSQGLLIKAPASAKAGDNLYEQLELDHYEPEMEHVSTGGNWEKAPPNWSNMSKYDVENLRSSKIRAMFEDGEQVVVTTKMNGSNCMYVFSDGKMYTRSRSGFRQREDNLFWRCLTPEIEKFCVDNPDTCLFGECVGDVKGFKYNLKPGEVKFFSFDILKRDRKYMDYAPFMDYCTSYGIPTVPLIAKGPFNYEVLLNMAEDPCPLGNPTPEGLVCKPLIERVHWHNGRVIGKIISNKYLEKA